MGLVECNDAIASFLPVVSENTNDALMPPADGS